MSQKELLIWLESRGASSEFDEQVYQQIRKLIEERPKVTKEFIDKWAKRCEQLYINCDDMRSRFVLNLPCQFERMLKEAGVEVEK